MIELYDEKYIKNSLAIKLIDWVELIIIYTYMRWRIILLKKLYFPIIGWGNLHLH